MTALADKAPITVRAKTERAHEGNESITTWCPTCEERVVPLRDGTCGWCETQLADGNEDAALAAAGLVEAAPSEAQGAPFDEQAGSAPVLSSPPPAEEESVRPAVPPPATAAARRRAPRGDAAWRREAIVEWVRDQGEVSLVEIRDHFELGNNGSDVYVLLQAGRLERTGETRPSPRKGPPSPVLRVPEEDLPPYLTGAPIEIPTSHAQTGDAEAEQPAAEAPRGDAADDDRTIEEGYTDEQEEPAAVGREVAAPTYQPAALTVGEELTVRYVRSLIGWIERGTMTREQAAPDHVLDRIERILGITEGPR